MTVENLEFQSPVKAIELIKSGAIAYEDLNESHQILVYENLLVLDEKPPELFLLNASQGRKHDFTHIRGDKSQPMDKNVYKVKPGNFVVVTYEKSSMGWSRAQADSFTEVLEDSEMYSGITIAKLPKVFKEEDLKGRGRDEVNSILLEHLLEGGSIEEIGLDEKNRLIEEMQGQDYLNVTVVGEVKKPPSHQNDGLLLLKGEEEDLGIDMSNVRELHVVGINTLRREKAKSQVN